MTKRHTRHSRRGFYPPKSEESTLPGLLYVAGDAALIEPILVPQNECEICAFLKGKRGRLKSGDNTVEIEFKLLKASKKDFHRVCGKACGKAPFRGRKWRKFTDL